MTIFRGSIELRQRVNRPVFAHLDEYRRRRNCFPVGHIGNHTVIRRHGYVLVYIPFALHSPPDFYVMTAAEAQQLREAYKAGREAASLTRGQRLTRDKVHAEAHLSIVIAAR